MRARWLLFVTGIVACTSGAVSGEYNEPPKESRVPDPPPPDGGLDASPTDVDAKPCSDCEYFPETCGEGVLCANGPFTPNTVGGSFDPRTSVNVIHGRSPSDVWAAGAVGALAHFDGTSWTRLELKTQESMRGLWLLDSVEVTLGVLDRVYAHGVDVQDQWSVYSPSYDPTPTDVLFTTAWAAPGSDWLWCGAKGMSGNTGLWRLRHSTSVPFTGGTGVPNAICKTAGCGHISSIHGASASELWAVGPAGAAVHVSNADSVAPSAKGFNSQTQNALNGVWTVSASEAWAVGAMGTIRHYTGDPMLWEIVSNVPTTADLNAVWGSSATDVWAVGDAGVVLHYDGNAWSRVKIAGLGLDRPNLNTVWVAAAGHVWVGGHGVILSLGGKP
jgi:hypothetical protein